MGEKIRQFREQIGLTQKELAALIGVDASSVSLWESGKNYPTGAKMLKLAEVFHCAPGDLF